MFSPCRHPDYRSCHRSSNIACLSVGGGLIAALMKDGALRCAGYSLELSWHWLLKPTDRMTIRDLGRGVAEMKRRLDQTDRDQWPRPITIGGLPCRATETSSALLGEWPAGQTRADTRDLPTSRSVSPDFPRVLTGRTLTVIRLAKNTRFSSSDR
jgi:hypothetical protein